MRIRLGHLRKIISEALSERATVPDVKRPMFNMVNNVQSPDTSDREGLGALADEPIDLIGDEDELPQHLRDPDADFEDEYGPVPPVVGDPYVSQDPFVRDSGPYPTTL